MMHWIRLPEMRCNSRPQVCECQRGRHCFRLAFGAETDLPTDLPVVKPTSVACGQIAERQLRSVTSLEALSGKALPAKLGVKLRRCLAAHKGVTLVTNAERPRLLRRLTPNAPRMVPFVRSACESKASELHFWAVSLDVQQC